MKSNPIIPPARPVKVKRVSAPVHIRLGRALDAYHAAQLKKGYPPSEAVVNTLAFARGYLGHRLP